MSCRVSKGRRTTNGRRSLKLRLFGFKQSCFPQAVKKEIELGYNVFCAGGIVNSCCRCDGSRRTSRALRTGLAPWTFWALGALWAGCSLWTCCSHLTLWSLRPSCSRFTYRTLWPLRSCSSCLSCRPLGTGLPGGSCLTLGPRVSGKSLWSPWSWRSHWTRSACATTAWSPWIRSPSAWPTTIRTAISGASAARSTVSRLCPHPVHNSRDVFQIHSFRQDHQNTYSGSFPIPFSSIFRLCKNRRFIFFCYYRICTRSLFCVHLSKAAFSSDLRSGL